MDGWSSLWLETFLENYLKKRNKDTHTQKKNTHSNSVFPTELYKILNLGLYFFAVQALWFNNPNRSYYRSHRKR